VVTKPAAIGKYKVTVSLRGNYTGTVTKYYKINPAATSFTSLKTGNDSFTAKWKVVKPAVSGYQIRYSLKKNISDKNAKTVTVKGSKAVKKTVKKLKNKKKYYVQIRTYKTVSGVKYYSSWSKAKSVKTR